MDTNISPSYGSDYLKKLVQTALGGSGQPPDSQDGSEEQSDQQEERKLPNLYNMGDSGSAGAMPPPQPTPEANGFIPSGGAAPSMGPRFKALVDSAGAGSVANAAAPVARAAVQGATSIAPSAEAIAKAFKPMTVRPPKGQNDFSNAGPPSGINELRERIGWNESSGQYGIGDGAKGATGKYQYMRPTWNGYGGYKDAKDAPPEVQDRRMHEDLAARLAATGNDVLQTIAGHIYPKWANDVTQWNKPIPGNGSLTMARYVGKTAGDDTTRAYIQDKLAKQAMSDHNDGHLYNLSAR